MIPQYDPPSWFVTFLGLSLGIMGFVYQVFNPEPLSLWLAEGLLFVVPSVMIIYGGYWIAKHPIDQQEGWIIAGWVLAGAVAVDTLVIGYIATQQLDSVLTHEWERLVLLGALGGSLIALLTAISTQYYYLYTGTASSIIANLGSKISSRYRDFDRFRREKGTIYALKVAIQNPKRSLLFKDRQYQTKKRIDLEDRWRIISTNLNKDAVNAVDIGCNEGEFTKRLANSDLLSFGIERTESTLVEARTSNENKLAYFISLELTPENIDQLPSFDVTLLLTVFYHWGQDFGWPAAEDMLRTVAAKTDQLFFETPATKVHIQSDSFKSGKEDDLIAIHKAYLSTVLGEDVDITHIGTTAYHGDDREELLFEIDCRHL